MFDVLQHAVRAKEILTVLARHGFADLLSKLELPSGLWHRLLPHPGPSRTPGERLRLAAKELEPTFVKLGQLLSMRPDVVPYDILLELRKLQDRVQPVPAAEMLPVLTHALGRPPAEVFPGWQDTPVATASLAQVYRAQLPTGETVAVKVRQPHLQHRLTIDFELALWLAGKLQLYVPALRHLDLPGVVAEARDGVLRELDFRHEARHQRYFNSLNPNPTEVYAPKVHDACSSESVLVMEWVDGTPVGQLRGDEPADQRRRWARGRTCGPWRRRSPSPCGRS